MFWTIVGAILFVFVGLPLALWFLGIIGYGSWLVVKAFLQGFFSVSQDWNKPVVLPKAVAENSDNRALTVVLGFVFAVIVIAFIKAVGGF